MVNKMENKNDVTMEKNYTVYMHVSPNGKVYIGITRRKPELRWKNGNGYKKHEYFYNAIQKYGWDNFEHIIIENNLSKEQAENMEIELIAKYRSTEQDRGYNIDNGGNTIGTHSIETRKKMSKNHANVKGGKHPLAKKVYCDGLIFDCLTQCGDYYSTSRRTIARLIKGEIKMNSDFKKLNLRYATNDDLNKYEKYDASKHGDKANIVKAGVKKGIGLKKGLMIYCDGLIFNTIKECANYYSVNRNSISRWLQGEYEIPLDFKKLNLRYATNDDLNKYEKYDASKHGNKANIVIDVKTNIIKACINNSKIQAKNVHCNGIIFNSVRQCSIHYGINYDTMKNWLQGRSKTPLNFQKLNLRYATENDLNTYPRYTPVNN